MSQSNFCTITLGGKTVVEPPHGFGRPTNLFRMTTGAARYGRGQYLLLSDDFNSINSLGLAGLVSLIISDGINPPITIRVRIGGAIPAVTSVKQAVPGLVEVIVFDCRTDQFSPVSGNQAYNVIAAPFSWSSDWMYWSSTLNSGAPWTWAQMLADMGLPPLPANPSWIPRNFEFLNTPLADAVDRVAAELFLVVGWDWQAGALNFNAPGVPNAANAKLLKNLIGSQSQMGGGSFSQSSARPPKIINAVFPVINLQSTDPYAQKEYSVAYTTGGSGPQTQALQVGYQPAAYQAGAIANSADLIAIGDDLAERAFAFMSVPEAAWTFGGIWPFQPDGVIREIVWESSYEGPTTKIFQHNGRDFKQLADEFRNFELPTNQLVDGIGSTQTSVSPAGTRYAWSGSGVTVTVRLGVTLADPSGVYGYTYGDATKYSYIQTGSPTTVTSGVITTFTDGQRCIVVNGCETSLYAPGNLPLHLLPTAYTGTLAANVYYQGEIVGTYTDSNGNVLPMVLINVEPSREVKLTVTSGSNGFYTASGSSLTLTAPSYTYNVIHPFGGTLWTGATPDCNRPNGVLTGPATRGIIGFGVGGAPTGLASLVNTDEQPDLSYLCACPPCPASSCAACPATYSPALSLACSNGSAINGSSYTITKSGCTWVTGTPTYIGGNIANGTMLITISCSGGIWTITVICTSFGPGNVYNQTWVGTVRSTGSCLASGAYTLTPTTGNSGCGNLTLTI